MTGNNRCATPGWYGDANVWAILDRGLPRMIMVLSQIIEDIDNRIGIIEKRLDAAVPPLPCGIPDDECERYFAFYALDGEENYAIWSVLRDDAARLAGTAGEVRGFRSLLDEVKAEHLRLRGWLTQ